MSNLLSDDSVSNASAMTNNDAVGSISNNEGNTEPDVECERQTLGRKESKAVFWLRLVVVSLLALTAALVATFVYKYASSSQQDNFESTFESDSLKVLDSFHRSIERILDSSDALSIMYTSFALATGATFPNVTLPNYQIQAAATRVMSDAVVFNYNPLVTDENRKGWESFVVENRQYLNESIATEFGFIAYQDALYNQSKSRNLQEEPQGYQDEITNLGMDGLVYPAPEGTGPYLPLWQLSPATPIPVLLNFNLLSHPAALAYAETLRSGQAVVLSATNLLGENLGGSGAYFQLLLSMSQFRDEVTKYLGEPTSPFSYPVFDSFDPISRKVAGVLTSTFYWKLYLENILPSTHDGIICVMENTFNQTFTYRIDGPRATYLGIGDLHDTKYDYLEVSGDMATYLKSRASKATKSYTIVPLNTDFNAYSLRIYPSQDTEDAQVNNEPVVITVIIICVFLFTSMVFLTYDWFVARRQRIVMDRAVASGAIVSSLFPSQVRDKIYEENEVKNKRKNWGVTDVSKDNFDENEEGASSRPNAVLFPNTTVMFADMVGFTSWSATRGPVEVFELLEAVYHAFDKIALRRKVFKVETIGDCYVAVAGLPNPQPDHAVIMVKFAEDCIAKMSQVTTELSVTMGADTADLMIRVGLHSGSVTGGVLRGQKARFQLFGDTMNTASRMESNGRGGSIHVSQETVDELTAKGKSHWVTTREDRICAKGKGELQTFWVSTRANNSSGPRSSTPSSNGGDDNEIVMNRMNQIEKDVIDALNNKEAVDETIVNDDIFEI